MYVASIVFFDVVSQRLRLHLVLTRTILLREAFRRDKYSLNIFFIVILSAGYRIFLSLVTRAFMPPNVIAGTDWGNGGVICYQ
jgi:hypothetical protein